MKFIEIISKLKNFWKVEARCALQSSLTLKKDALRRYDMPHKGRPGLTILCHAVHIFCCSIARDTHPLFVRCLSGLKCFFKVYYSVWNSYSVHSSVQALYFKY